MFLCHLGKVFLRLRYRTLLPSGAFTLAAVGHLDFLDCYSISGGYRALLKSRAQFDLVLLKTTLEASNEASCKGDCAPRPT